MELKKLEKKSDYEWEISPYNGMRVPAVIYASRRLVEDMDDKVFQQIKNVASLPGIVKAAYVMPDAHWGYGFPIGGVAAFDAAEGGVISAGGVGFDISCGVRMIRLGGMKIDDLGQLKEKLAGELFRRIPAGMGSESGIRLGNREMDEMLTKGAAWAVEKGYGFPGDLERIEGHGKIEGALPEEVSSRAKERLREEIGSLGSGNHYLEVQTLEDVFDEKR